MNNLQNIPTELKAFKQWICWRLEWKKGDFLHEGKPTKVPYSISGWPASVSNAQTWSDFETVCNADIRAHAEPCEPTAPIAETGFSGIGFVFTENDPYCGVDLDPVPADHPDYAELWARQQKIFYTFNSYAELSPSGQGLHIICKAKLPGNGRRRALIEIYDKDRYFTMTGNVFKDAPIENRQELANILYAELGAAVQEFYVQEQPQKEDDETILNRAANASNGLKFQALWNGDWGQHYPSQSEADFALIDILAFYTQNRAQIIRLFRQSALGQRKKAERTSLLNHMIDRSFDRQLPPIDTEGLTIAFEKMLAERNGKSEGAGEVRAAASEPNTAAPAICNAPSQPFDAETAEQPLPDLLKRATIFPDGLVGEIAQFIYESAPRPVPEIALAGALGFMAGICGRAYNVGSTGLNQYIILVAKTARGKEAMAMGISHIIDRISSHCPTIRDFIGPTQIASPQGLIAWLTKQPCVYSIIGEFGLKLKEMINEHANANTQGLRALLLDLYMKSGNTQVLGAGAYSKKENNTSIVQSPAFTLIGETTPTTLYENFSEAMITQGLLSRFTIIDYMGKRVRKNKNHGLVEPSVGMLNRISGLVAQAQAANAQNKVLQVAISPEAQAIFDSFDRFCDDECNREDKLSGEVSAELWNRGDLKAQKLAALIAVGISPFAPVITAELAIRATNDVYAQTRALKARFDNDEIGGGSVETSNWEAKQEKFMVRVIAQFALKPYEECAVKYGITEACWKAKVFPYSALQTRLMSQTCFVNDRQGSTQAIKRTYQNLLDSDDLRELSKEQMLKEHGKKCRAFQISNADRFLAVDVD